MVKRKGDRTLVFPRRPAILSTASIVGPREGDGPLGDMFDVVKPDSLLGEKTWEKAEIRMLQEAIELAVHKADWGLADVQALFCGDLLNQLATSNYASRQFPIPFFGLYGACSTFVEGLILGALYVDGSYGNQVLVAASSHHDTAERQYRYPTEFGHQRPSTAQFTVSGAGAVGLGQGQGPLITHATPGQIVDQGISDVNDMGSAMAPAAADTIVAHLTDTGRGVDDYDLIITGDLGRMGKAALLALLKQANIDLSARLVDCGSIIYDHAAEVLSGGSGCGCIAVTFASYFYEEMQAGRANRVLLVATGSLHSPDTIQQGETIPGIAHAVALENSRGGNAI